MAPMISTHRTRFRTPRNWSRSESGAASLEGVVLIPAIMLIVLLGAQYAIWYQASSVVRTAASEGARTSSIEDKTAADGDQRTRAYVTRLGGRMVRDVQVDSTRDNEMARIAVRANSPSLLPGLSLRVGASSERPIERFRSRVS